MYEAYEDADNLRLYLPDHIPIDLVDKAYLFNVRSTGDEQFKVSWGERQVQKSH